ncbi:MAG: cytochrome c biogenesis protein ResB [Syntrophaceae bacterium]|nr:cytochrome c biogenesis protein ResB [Syntrophaceae bacterium]
MKEPANSKESGFFTILYDLFRSLKLTIFLLILLAILSIIGTLIEQNASHTEYVQRYGPGLYEVLNFFNLFDMYHSWWFSAILLLLAINVVTCSIQRLPGVWKQISYQPSTSGLEDSMLKALPYIERIRVQGQAKASTEENIRSGLKKWFRNQRRMETESAITLYSEKGTFSRLGVYITHLSLLIILIGGLIGSQFGFKGFVNILEGETVDHIYERRKNGEISRPLRFSVRCDEFNITYYDLERPEKHVKEYTSILTILEDGKEVLKKDVRVNHPLHYKGLAFYQSNYGKVHDITLGIQWGNKKEKTTFQVPEGVNIPVPNSNGFIRVLQYAPQVHNFGEGVQLVLIKPNQDPRPFWLLKNFPKLDERRGDEFTLTFEGISSKEYTGLQVTKDPGVWVVWTGCGLMILGLIISFFFSHQRIWVRIPKGQGEEIVLAGSTNKNRLGFEKTFDQLVEGVRKKS